MNKTFLISRKGFAQSVRSLVPRLLCGAMLCLALPVLGQNVTPAPQQCEQHEGSFNFKSATWWYTNLPEEDANRLAAVLQQWPVKMVRSGKPLRARMQFRLVTDSLRFSSPEAYSLSVSPKEVLVEARQAAGLYYGAQTLKQLFTDDNKLPALEITDAPRFEYRGVMLDVSRHFFSKEFVKKQMDAMARYKINRLHLHLTDAAGWRLEIKRYPELTEFAAWRPEATWKEWCKNGSRYVHAAESESEYGGFYTQDDIREILAYAKDRYITVIPEIEMPSHSEEVLTTYPELSCTGQPYKHSDFCIGNEKTFQFLQNVLDEVMELFPSEYIHIGGDEAGKQAWKTCPLCQKRMQEENLSDVDELQRYLITRIGRYINSKGRKMMGWDEILQGNFTPGSAAVMSWRGEQGGHDAVKSGSRAVMTPGAYCYIDSYQDAPHTQPEAIGGYLPLQKVYSYNPVPASFTPSEAKLIYGVQCNLWAEYIPDSAHVEYMLYPRVLALAEVGWTAPERKDWTGFHTRALQEVDYLKQAGYNPFDLKNEVGHRPESLQPVEHLALNKPVCYTLPYSPSYPAQGNTTLTDGKRGDWTYGDGAWQGFISEGRLDVTVDLGQVMDLQRIAADFMQVTGAQVYLPQIVKISVSDDNQTFAELKQREQPVNKERSVAFETVAWEGNARARYVRLQADSPTEEGGWVFTDELIVR